MDQPERGKLSLEEIRGLFSSNRGFLRDVRSIQITGGELFLRADLPLSECTFWIPTNGMTPHSIENAIRTTLDSLDDHGLGVSVSIDGLGRTHDGVRGIPGSFERAVETLARLSAVRGDHPGLGLSVGMTLTPENFRELGDVFNLARSHGAKFSFRPVNYSGIYYRNIGDELSIAGFEGELFPAIRGIGRDAVERHGLWNAAPTLRYMQGVMDHVRNPRV